MARRTTFAPKAAGRNFCPLPLAPSRRTTQEAVVDNAAATEAPRSGKKVYTCPMHPEVRQDHPGVCPKCGMALEPETVTAGTDDEQDAELHDMTRRLWIGAALALPVFVLAMAHLIPVIGHDSWVMSGASRWIQFALTVPVV